MFTPLDLDPLSPLPADDLAPDTHDVSDEPLALEPLGPMPSRADEWSDELPGL